MEEDNPCKDMVANWKQKARIKKTSFLKKTTEIATSFQFPENRETSTPIPTRSPHTHWRMPKISKDLIQKGDKSMPPQVLKTIAYETIDRYSPSSIKAYTDGSAEKATRNGGYGSYICIPQQETPISLKGPCGKFCNNYDAEVIAMKETIQELDKGFTDGTIIPSELVILTDSQSALEAIENYKNQPTPLIEHLLNTCHVINKNHGKEIYLQWIPGHCGIIGNEKADALAKQGSKMPQTDGKVTYRTAKSLAKEHSRTSWNTQWIQNDTGRELFKHQNAPNPKDPINQLERKHQCNIFRLRTGHSVLNAHRHRLDPLIPPRCRHCHHPFETVEHHLLHCRPLTEMRTNLLPENPTISNCLYGNRDQLIKTSTFHTLALRV